MATRESGFYWLKDQYSGRRFVAKFDGEYWSFVGSLHVVADDELDDEFADNPVLIMSRYQIEGRIPEPLS